DGQHKAIISEEQWDRVQKIRKKRSHRPAQSKTPYFLTSLIKCPKCGYGMVAAKSKISKDKYYRYYICGLFHNKCKNACRSHSIRAERAEQQVLDIIKTIATNSSMVSKILKEVNKQRTAVKTKINKILDELIEDTLL